MRLDTQPKRLSPLHDQHHTLGARFDLRDGWLIPEVYTSSAEEKVVLREAVGLVDISARGKLTLKGVHAGAIISATLGESPSKPGHVIKVKSKHVLVANLTQDEYLILTPPAAEKDLESSLNAESSSQDAFVSIIDQTSGLVGFSISGTESRGVMRKLCVLSFNPKNFPDLHVVQSSFAKVRATIIRHDQGDSPAYELFADRSYSNYLWDTNLDAGREFSLQPVGWDAIIE